MRFNNKLKNDLSFLKNGIKTQNTKFNNLIAMTEKVAMKSTDPMLSSAATAAGKS